MEKTSADIARATYDAYVRKDRAAIEALIAADFHFTSPLDNRLDRATYFARCWPNSQSITGFDFVHVVTHAKSNVTDAKLVVPHAKLDAADGDRVFVTYEARTHRGNFRNTELLTIRDGQVVEVEVYFGWSIPHAAPAGGFVDDKTQR